MPKGQRTYWKGHLRLSLVSVAVELYPAVSSTSRVTMNQIHKPSGKRVRYEKVVPGIGPVQTSDIVRGFEVDKDTYVIVEPEELEQLKLESKHTIDLVQFVDVDELDPRYYERPYYMRPGNDVSIEGFQIIREALRDERKVGIGQMTMRGQEYLVAIRPFDRGLLLETLRYADEVRASDNLFEDLPGRQDLDTDKVSLAKELIARKSGPFDPAAFRDHYGDALRELIAEKQANRPLVSTEDEAPRRSAEVIDLMAALKRSVAGERDEGASVQTTERGSRKSPAKAARKKSGSAAGKATKSSAGKRGRGSAGDDKSSSRKKRTR
jgi:DNA end-binding protein Ku